MSDLHGMVWTNWRSVPPPKRTYVIGRYDRADRERTVYRGMTCRGGCCWDVGHGAMTLPQWWAPCEDQTSQLAGVPLQDPFSHSAGEPRG